MMTPRIPFWLRLANTPTFSDGGVDPAADHAPTEPSTPAAGEPAETEPAEQQLGDPGKKALAAERKARRDAETALREAQKRVTEYEQRDMSDNERLTQQLAEAKTRAEKAEAENLRLRVASEVGLDPDLHEFLDGITDEEQMRARATKLAAKAGTTTPASQPPDFGGGDRGAGVDPLTSLDQQITEAEKAGDFRRSVHLKRQRAALAHQTT